MQGPSSCACHQEIAAAGWELPSHQLNVFHERRARYATVIPVWNEGSRLSTQLGILEPYRELSDVIIADGDSSDGSSDSLRLRALGVRSVVTVFERGASLALRPAIAHVLLDGYDGVIVMDGNNKDDPESIRTCAQALDRGADYVQGSRYIAGGSGINTPWDRALLIRAIHSPLYSLACRRPFTDSTTGPRAFSRRFLLDPRVRPFRHRFRWYDLYFYLGWRACRLGFAAVEVPVTRAYPRDAPTPTKIRSPLAYWRMLAPLFWLLLGSYD